jgi:hypothetical protein
VTTTRLTSPQAEDTIVSLNKRKATLRSKILLDVMEYWEGMRAGASLPRRSEIDPRRIEGALPYAFILEEIAPGLARFRVAGGHLNDLMGMEVRGMPLSAMFIHSQRNTLLPMIEQVFRGPSSLELTLSSRKPGHEATYAEMLLLPLLDDAGNATRALGCLVAQGTLVSPPYRFEVTASRKTPLPAPMTRPEPRRPALRAEDRMLEGFHEPYEAYRPKPTPALTPAPVQQARAVPHYLKVVK